MEIQAKSIIISRRKVVQDVSYSCLISFFNINNPHLGGEEPLDIKEFENAHKVIIRGPKEINYMLFGSDIIINDIKKLEIEHEGKHILVKVEQ
ncbi:hypothetical protein J4468_01245 [Candidatus Woesearchaeota archaeon]|nr:hypothetical protein [Candidatus Woesearchaeota archaeon]